MHAELWGRQELGNTRAFGHSREVIVSCGQRNRIVLIEETHANTAAAGAAQAPADAGQAHTGLGAERGCTRAAERWRHGQQELELFSTATRRQRRPAPPPAHALEIDLET